MATRTTKPERPHRSQPNGHRGLSATTIAAIAILGAVGTGAHSPETPTAAKTVISDTNPTPTETPTLTTPEASALHEGHEFRVPVKIRRP